MRLSDFVQQNRERIIGEWVKFAATLLPWAKGLTEEELRDHAEALLEAIVADMKLPQSDTQRLDKSRGQATEGALGRIGQQHAAQRLESGFDLDQLVSEYRALRASVLRLWEESHGEEQGEVTRFNEAIDESLAESTTRYSQTVETTREQFLGVLGHDLRNPLNAIAVGAKVLASSQTLDDKDARVAARILASAERMSRMVADLLDLTRSRLGPGIPVEPRPTDLSLVCEQVLSELEVLHPKSRLRFEARGNLHGEWDTDRLAQVLSNLVSNALQYGEDGGTVTVVAEGREEVVVLTVHNGGAPIPREAMKHIFNPMARRRPPSQRVESNPSGLGLGLFIANEIVVAHGGTIEVASDWESGTTFCVRLPRSSLKKG